MVISQPVEQRIGLPPVLSRAEMRRELLDLPGGVSGMVWHVGSDPSDPQEALNNVVIPELKRSGYASWIQSSDVTAGDMKPQIYYQPELGLVWDGSHISFEPGHEEQLLAALGSPEGIDLHLESAPVWKLLLDYALQTGPKIRLLKTHFATPTCTEGILTEDVKPWQADIYRALMLGHLINAYKIASTIVVSADNPDPFDINQLIYNFELMFGDRFDDSKLIEQGTEVLRAIHCCGDGDFLGAMSTGAVDVVHFDALKYPTVLRGRPQILKEYLLNGGMIAWGGVPQFMELLADLAVELGFDRSRFPIRGFESYIPYAEFLKENFDRAQESVSARYDLWLSQTADESKVDRGQIARQTYISTTCGFGKNRSKELREVSYALARSVSRHNHELAS